MELTITDYIKLLEDLSSTMQKALYKFRNDCSRGGFISLDEQDQSDESMSDLVHHANETYLTLTQSGLGNIRSQLESVSMTSEEWFSVNDSIMQLACFFWPLSPFTVNYDYPYVSDTTKQNRQDLEGGGDLLKKSIKQLKEKIRRLRFFQQCLIGNDDAQCTSTEPAGKEVKGQASKEGKNRKGVGGPHPISGEEEQKRLNILDDWEKAKGAGIKKPDFCKDKGISVDTLDKYMDWKYERDKRKKKKIRVCRKRPQ